MHISGTALAIILFLLLGTACASEVSEGRGTLPPGMENDLVPDVDYQTYLYFNAGTPVELDIERLRNSDQEDLLIVNEDDRLNISSVSMVATSLDEFAGILEFTTPTEAEIVRNLLDQAPPDAFVAATVDASTVRLMKGDSIWTTELAGQYETGEMTPLREHSPQAWNMLTNLPISKDNPPIAAGFVSTGGDLIQSIADDAGIEVPGLDTAFGMVRVNNVAFGIYSDTPALIPKDVDVEFLGENDTGIVLVGSAGYAGVAVAFLVRSIAAKIGMDTITLANTNARYLKLETGHLILKNKGSLIYTAVAGTRQQAEELMLLALASDHSAQVPEKPASESPPAEEAGTHFDTD